MNVAVTSVPATRLVHWTDRVSFGVTTTGGSPDAASACGTSGVIRNALKYTPAVALPGAAGAATETWETVNGTGPGGGGKSTSAVPAAVAVAVLEIGGRRVTVTTR